jgi:SAM-dependent methyltransferase
VSEQQGGDGEDLLAEQQDFYRADAVQFDRWLSTVVDARNDDAEARTYRAGCQRVADHLYTIRPLGQVLEIAAGTGRLAELYLPLADSVVLVDSSPESLVLAAERLLPSATADVKLIEADIFDWEAGPRTFDTILFSAWLHHVPHDKFDLFWQTVERLLAPAGVVVFDFPDARVPSPGRVDIPEVPTDGYTFYAPVNGVSIRDQHGRRWRVVHNLWRPDDLASQLHETGWEFTILGPGLFGNILWATAHR